ncbi:MAG: DUF4184 family protein [Promethearchaeota archaeon]|nr:MAG: DUF4184 family protein [Candidatus Lokiarchaeota archaeon]
MPNGLISHPAPGLFLKIKYPKKFDGTALCISAIAPDFNVFVSPFLPFDFRSITHSLLGLIIYTIPITIILSILFCSYIGPYIAKIAKKEKRLYKPLRFFGLDHWNYLKSKKYDKKYFIMVFYSALIGGLTHILFDLPAHGRIVMFFPLILQSPDFLLYSIVDFGPIMIGPFLIQRNFTIYQIIWFIEDIILLVGSLYLLRYIKKNNLISKWYIGEKGVTEK